MLGSTALPTRMGGIYALERIAAEHPDEYHIQIMGLLCAFIRYAGIMALREVVDKAEEEEDELICFQVLPTCPLDVEAAALAIGNRNDRQLELDRKKDAESTRLTRWPDLQHANLSGAMLTGGNFSGVDLCKANLSGAKFTDTDLSGAKLSDANLSETVFVDANLTNADLFNANLSSAKLGGATGIKQATLIHAYIEEGADPPILYGAHCTQSGNQLVWEGKTVNRQGQIVSFFGGRLP